MDSHLVTVEVGIVSGASQRVEFKCATFGKDRFKCLDTESVQSRRTVKEDGVFFNDFFKDSPNVFGSAFDFFLGGFNGKPEVGG